MTHDTRTPDEIERDIERDRLHMSNTIDDLQKKFSVNAIAEDVGYMVRDIGGDVSRAIRRTAGRNPAALVVVGAGLAWLIVGSSRKTSEGPRPGSHRSDFGQGMSDDEASWYSGARRNPAHRHDTSSGASGMMGRVGETASELSERLSHGLEDLSEAAKARVMRARRAAHDAREAVMHRGAGTADLFRDQPLVVGALAVAMGAAVGSLLPHSRFEDETMGAHSDKLFRDAQAIYREERDKAMAVVKGAARDVKEEVKDIGSDLKAEARDTLDDKNVGEAVADRTTDAAKRVYDNAKDRASSSQSGNNRQS